MSRTINDSVQLLTETLGNCKSALTEKQVADVDNIKISDVDEKIAEITAGGGEGFQFIENVSVDFGSYKTKLSKSSKVHVSLSGQDRTVTIKFKTKDIEGNFYEIEASNIADRKVFFVEPEVIRGDLGTGSKECTATINFKSGDSGNIVLGIWNNSITDEDYNYFVDCLFFDVSYY